MNCHRNFPWYKGWQQQFGDRGLVIIGVHTPETAAERDPGNVQRRAREAGLTFPIAIDNEFAIWNAWGNSMWPSVYLIDKRGDVRYWWIGELKWEGADGEKLLRRRIEELLKESP